MNEEVSEGTRKNIYLQMYLGMLGYNVGSTGKFNIGADGSLGDKTTQRLNEYLGESSYTDMDELLSRMKNDVISKANKWEEDVRNTSSLLSKDDYELANPVYYLRFVDLGEDGIDPIFAGRLAAFSKNNNIILSIADGYRSTEEQIKYYVESGGYKDENDVWTGGNGSAARPGYSWHEYGEAIDIWENGN